jgi:hypothetical protein
MTGQNRRQSDDEIRARQRIPEAEHPPEWSANAQPSTASAAYHTPALLDAPSLAGRANSPVRAASMHSLQRTHGNRAVQRCTYHSTASVQRMIVSDYTTDVLQIPGLTPPRPIQDQPGSGSGTEYPWLNPEWPSPEPQSGGGDMQRWPDSPGGGGMQRWPESPGGSGGGGMQSWPDSPGGGGMQRWPQPTGGSGGMQRWPQPQGGPPVSEQPGQTTYPWLEPTWPVPEQTGPFPWLEPEWPAPDAPGPWLPEYPVPQEESESEQSTPEDYWKSILRAEDPLATDCM